MELALSAARVAQAAAAEDACGGALPARWLMELRPRTSSRRAEARGRKSRAQRGAAGHDEVEEAGKVVYDKRKKFCELPISKRTLDGLAGGSTPLAFCAASGLVGCCRR